jgi:hypothetical protein
VERFAMIAHVSAEPNQPTPEIGSDLGFRRESYRRRLDDGYARIDEAALSGSDVSEWESFWIRLLREYEDVCRELDRAA